MNETLPFDKIKNYIDEKNYAKLKHSKQQVEEHDRWLADILNEWNSLYDFILYREFHKSFKLNKANKKCTAKQSLIDKNISNNHNIYVVDDCYFSCCVSDFKHNFENNIIEFEIYKYNENMVPKMERKKSNKDIELVPHDITLADVEKVVELIFNKAVFNNDFLTNYGFKDHIEDYAFYVKNGESESDCMPHGHLIVKTDRKVTNKQMKELPKFKENNVIYFFLELYIYAIIGIFVVGVSYTIANKYDFL